VTVRIVDVGDACVTLELDPRVDPQLNDTCLVIADRVARTGLRGVRDIVATYHTVAVYINPLLADREAIVDALSRGVAPDTRIQPPIRALHEIPVCYGDEYGPDLDDVARFGGCTGEDVVRLHSERTYRVYMMGFLPGFAYLGKVNERIAMGRHETPRMQVAARSVAIAGFQTGIYPLDAPGGWRVIGRTWITPFDPARPEPSLLQAGDMVRFAPISRQSYREAVERSRVLEF
jgi:inhibitor of KinA